MMTQPQTPPDASASWPPPYCKACRFWDPFDADERRGECRRHSPRAAMNAQTTGDDDTGFTNTLWPVTTSTDWCGDHETLGGER